MRSPLARPHLALSPGQPAGGSRALLRSTTAKGDWVLAAQCQDMLGCIATWSLSHRPSLHYEIWKYCQSTGRVKLEYYRISECLAVLDCSANPLPPVCPSTPSSPFTLLLLNLYNSCLKTGFLCLQWIRRREPTCSPGWHGSRRQAS